MLRTNLNRKFSERCVGTRTYTINSPLCALSQCIKEMELGKPTSLEEVIDQSAIMTVPELLKVVNAH